MTRRNPDTVIVVLPGPDDPYFAATAVRAGVRGYLLDTAGPQVVRAAVRTAAGGLVFGPGIGPRALHLLDEQTSADMRSVHSGPSMMGSPPLRSCLAP